MMRGFIAMATAAIVLVPAGPALAQKLHAPEAIDPTPRVNATGPAIMAIFATIGNQIQPCADRQVIPAPEASGIAAVVRLHLNPDGSLASLQILDHQGVNASNQRYVSHVDKAVEAIFTGCTPFHGLPPELYDGPKGWRQITVRYRLRT